MTTIAVLDDYTRIARNSADWDSLPGKPEVRFHHDRGPSRELLLQRLADVDIICTMRERTRIDAAMLEALPQLKMIAATGRGQASLDVAKATELGIMVTVTGGGGGDSTGELTWGLIIALMRQIPTEDTALRRGEWQTVVGTGLDGKTLGILGLGRIGSHVAEIARAFRMQIVAWGPTLTAERAERNGAEMVSKEELFRRADVITIHWVLSDVTRGLIGAAELNLMKPTAFLVNTSRGPIVQQQPLLDVLASGSIAGAALDVYDQEPMPDDHPLLSLPNTVLTPHLGYATEEGYRAFHSQQVENIRNLLDGHPTNVFNPDVLQRPALCRSP